MANLFSMENSAIYSSTDSGNISLKNSTEEHTICETGLDRLLDTKIPYHTLVITHCFLY